MSGLKLSGGVVEPPVISEAEVTEWYTQAHAVHRFSGKVYLSYLPLLSVVFPAWRDWCVLDYGCGPEGGVVSEVSSGVGYDPYVAKYAADPWKGHTFDLFFSSDVFEHLTDAQVLKVLKQIKASAITHVFLAIATRSAKKMFNSTTNIHRTVRPPEWWHTRVTTVLGKEYLLNLFAANRESGYVALAFSRVSKPVEVVDAKAA